MVRQAESSKAANDTGTGREELRQQFRRTSNGVGRAACLVFAAMMALQPPGAPQAAAKDLLAAVATELPKLDAPCPDRHHDREAAAPFIEAMFQVGNRQTAADLYKAMAPYGLARIAALVRLAEEQRKFDWANLCRYRSENARDLACGSHPEVVFVGDSITENWKHA